MRTQRTFASSASDTSTGGNLGFIEHVKSCFQSTSAAQRDTKDDLIGVAPSNMASSTVTIGFFSSKAIPTSSLREQEFSRNPSNGIQGQSSTTTGQLENKDRGTVYKLIDFGTAVGVRDEDGNGEELLMTVSEIKFAGTLPYCSPESFNDVKNISFPSDIWSLAVTLFHVTSGKLPFEAPDVITASIQIGSNLDLPPPDVRDFAPETVRADISTAFAKVVSKGMEKRIVNRYRNVDEMATALHGCLVSSGENMYSAFISYRVFSERYHAMMLYEVLNNTITPMGNRVIVYLDVKRLVKGEDWEEGFSQGLMNSLVALPLISAGLIDPLTKLTGSNEDPPDNVAKELILMQALCKLFDSPAKVESIFPILVGRPCSVADKNYPRSGNFFTDGSNSNVKKLIDQVSPPTMESVKKFLKRKKIHVPEETFLSSISSTVKDLFSLQCAQLWNHGDLPSEEIPEDSELWETVSKDQTVPPLDLAHLRMMKAEMRALVPAIHAVVDSAHTDSARRKQAIEHVLSRRIELMTKVVKRMETETIKSVFQSWAQSAGDAPQGRRLRARLHSVAGGFVELSSTL